MAETTDERAERQHYVGTRTIRPDGVDKVTGRARFGADYNLPGQLIGRVLRSPHPHATIVSIDTSKAEALPGVKAVITRDDFGDQPSEFIPAGEMMMNYKDVVRNVMAREKALYEGHAVAAVAATSAAIARKALKLIDVKYEVLPHVIDVVEAMQPGAPLLHDDLFTVGRRAEARQAVQRRQARRDRAGRHRGRLQEGRRHRRARVQDRARAPGLHRAARGAGQRVRGRLRRAVGHDAGPLHRARALRAAARHGHRQAPRDRHRDRRRVRRQDRRLSRAARPRALAQGQAPREDGHVARGSLQGLGPDVRRHREGEDGRHEGRQVRGRLRRAEVPGRRVPGLARAAGRDVRLRAVRDRAT